MRITVDKYQELAKLKDLKISIGVGTEMVMVSKEVQTKEKKRKCK